MPIRLLAMFGTCLFTASGWQQTGAHGLLTQLFQSLSRTSDGAFVIDKDQRVIFWNWAAEEILGFSAGDVTGRQCFEILGGRDEQGRTLCQRYCRIAIQADRGDVLPNTDVCAMTRSGNGRWLNVTTLAYPVGDTAKDQVIVHLFRDASDKKETQRFIDSVMAASDQLQKNNRQLASPVTPANTSTGGLTAREQQVLALLAEGQGTDEMAKALVVSPATVRNHVQNILTKLGVHSRLEAVAHAYQQGLIGTNNK